jgi:regulatory protein
VDSEQGGIRGTGACASSAQELRRKGVADDVVRDALDEIDPGDEQEAARELVRRKVRSMSRLDDQTKTRRLVAMLGRKGYAPGVAFAVVRAELAACDGDEADVPESDL